MEAQLFGNYTAWKALPNTWFITTGAGSMYLYLIEGRDAALLIDTAYGFGDLRSFAERLTDKPIIVANTHGHLDHSGGNGWWHKAFMHRGALIDQATLHNSPFDISTLPNPDYEKIFLADGDKISLGDREITVFETLGHSPGGLFFFDAAYGHIFVGDELESTQVILIPNSDKEPPLQQRVENHLHSMKRLRGMADKITAICPAHNGAPITAEYIHDFIALDEQMLAGTQAVSPAIEHKYVEMRPDVSMLRRARYGKASFIYKVEE